MHPNFEDVTLHSDFHTELLQSFVIVLLDSPSKTLRKFTHLFFLLYGELGSESLPTGFIAPAILGGGGSWRSFRPVAAGIEADRSGRRADLVVREWHRVRRREEGREARSRLRRWRSFLWVPSWVVEKERTRWVAGTGAGTFTTVEVAMATAGGALECFETTVIAAGHELAAAIIGLATHGGGMVAHALTVASGTGGGGGGAGGIGEVGIRYDA